MKNSNVMKRIFVMLSAALFAVMLGMSAQAQTGYAADWNPDADGDDNVGVSDLLALLSVFSENDEDGDGIWDSQDDCIGGYDACGVCNGTGEDTDEDGICDEVDDCVGAYDECGVCNGPGPNIPVIDEILYETDSVFIEVLGEWYVFEYVADTLFAYGGPEISGCTNELAINYDPVATDDDGSCYVPAFPFLHAEVQAETDLGTTYRVYAYFENADDECTALFAAGSAESNPVDLELEVTTAFYQNPVGSNLGSDINSTFFMIYPMLEYDSWLTIGSESTNDEPVSSIGMSDAFAEFQAGNGFVLNTPTGGSWYMAAPGTNSLAVAGEDGRVLLAQLTVADDEAGEAGDISGLWNMQWRQGGSSTMENRELYFTTGTYIGPIEGCTDETALNYNEYATDDDGSCSYPEPTECGGTSTVTYDGYAYDLVAIGNQCWFAENLRTEHYANGQSLVSVSELSIWYVMTVGAQTIYLDNANNLADYGRLYNWYAVEDVRGLCPSGWHVPTNAEYTELAELLQEQGAVAPQMKSSPEDNPSWNGTNTSGFSALAGGRLNSTYNSEGSYAYFWTSSVANGNVSAWMLNGSDIGPSQISSPPSYGYSVRCIKDSQ